MTRMLILFFALLASAYVYADGKPATDASVKELLKVTQSQKMLSSVFNQVNAALERSVRQRSAARNLNAKQRAILEDMRKQYVSLFRSTMSWKTLEPEVVRIYKDNFTESEVKAIIRFYKTPAGHALIQKMPTVMQASMRATRDRMRTMMPQLRALALKTAQRLKEAKTESAPDAGK